MQESRSSLPSNHRFATTLLTLPHTLASTSSNFEPKDTKPLWAKFLPTFDPFKVRFGSDRRAFDARDSASALRDRGHGDNRPFPHRRSGGRRWHHSYTELTVETRHFSPFPFARPTAPSLPL